MHAAGKAIFLLIGRSMPPLASLEFISLCIPLLMGMLLGGFFLGSLWFTVRRLPHVKSPWRLYVASFVIRMSVVAAGFYFLTVNRSSAWPLAGLLGFVLIRTLGVRWGAPLEDVQLETQEVPG